MSLKPSTILVVDDEPTLCRVISRILNRIGFEIVEAPNGNDGINKLNDTIKGAIIDLGLPDIPGTEVMMALRAQRPDLPILLTSGSDFRKMNISEDAQTLCLHKPFMPSELREKVTKLFGDAS